MLTFYLLFGIVYGVLILILSSLWKQDSLSDFQYGSKASVTVIIPFRNEEANLVRLFDSIKRLTFRPFQVIFVNDRSQDKGRDILEDLIEHNRDVDIQFVMLDNEGEGKKEAIKTAIKNAIGNCILTTDADCILPQNWVEITLAQLSRPHVRMAAGPVMTLGGNRFFDHFQQIEWASILLITQAGFEWGNPIMCSAANMAYEKSAFVEAKPYERNLGHLSGDDEFLLKKIHSLYGAEAIVYIISNLVWTNPQSSWKELFSQRIRWVSKWKLHDSLSHTLFSIVPWLIQVVFISSIALPFQGKTGLIVFAFLWIFKTSVEWRVLGKILQSFGIHHGALAYFLTSIIHPFYVFFIGCGSLTGKFQWKGRSSSQLP
jgi:biofilm PGA synthesis N-glycosyltransferase PgaC